MGNGRKIVIITASNVEGGVMEWKGAREWAIERVSLWNKKNTPRNGDMRLKSRIWWLKSDMRMNGEKVGKRLI